MHFAKGRFNFVEVRDPARLRVPKGALNDFVLADREIPYNCLRVKPSVGEPLPFGMPSNPTILRDSSFVKFVSYWLETTDFIPTIQAVLFSVYRCEREIGLDAIEFTDRTEAKNCESWLKENFPGTERSQVYRAGNLIILLWRDAKSDTCFREFQDAVLARLK